MANSELEHSVRLRLLRLQARVTRALGEDVDGERIEDLPGEMNTVRQQLTVLEDRMRAVEGRLSLLEERVDILEGME